MCEFGWGAIPQSAIATVVALFASADKQINVHHALIVMILND